MQDTVVSIVQSHPHSPSQHPFLLKVAPLSVGSSLPLPRTFVNIRLPPSFHPSQSLPWPQNHLPVLLHALSPAPNAKLHQLCHHLATNLPLCPPPRFLPIISLLTTTSVTSALNQMQLPSLHVSPVILYHHTFHRCTPPFSKFRPALPCQFGAPAYQHMLSSFALHSAYPP